jgi:hypothetical protein
MSNPHDSGDSADRKSPKFHAAAAKKGGPPGNATGPGNNTTALHHAANEETETWGTGGSRGTGTSPGGLLVGYISGVRELPGYKGENPVRGIKIYVTW